MNMTAEAMLEARSTERGAAVPCACIDLDRFCNVCGYNLRTLSVYRDERLGIPVVRCPECGRFQAANEGATALHPWLNRVTSLLVGLWILLMIAVIVHLAVAEAALSYATLDELTIHSGYTTQRIGTSVVTTWTGSFGPLEVKTDYRDYGLFITSILTVSFLTAFVCGVLAVVVFPHWRRVACLGLVLFMPVLVGCIVAAIWHKEAPHLFDWALPYIAVHLAAQLSGGVVGILTGRPLARLAVRIILPQSLRPRLAYLWFADGKSFPQHTKPSA